ncbi:ASPIC/UnbV domain-containing protein [Enhygromyxa salina]|uniref:ASPIC/UnbV domain-containing protein n=1 Tax=Enhygromyxa salina TaxID=215803 RepID=A0A0C2CRZ7_9BACT|nr:CRTAC1 family protein [Enhygromyxa salina]KIG12425.1 ASPIC/UnbV domain-containing protein [Enhygromyxa salina]
MTGDWVRIACASVLLLAACRGPDLAETSAGVTTNADQPTEEDESESATETGDPDGLQPFEPEVCGSWNPPAATPAGTPPAEQACAGQEICPVFTEVAEAAGLGTVQFVPTHPSKLDCMFPWATSGGLSPRQDCEPQWFTGGVSVGDVNADGWPDVFMTRLAAPDHLFLNQGDGTFVDVAAQVGLGDCSWTNGSVFGDIDEDGDLDLLVTSVGATEHQLWINTLSETGELGFDEQAAARGFALSSTLMHSGEGVTLGDYDRDGWLDVHVNEWIKVEHMPTPEQPAWQRHGGRLLHNTGQGNFEDVTAAYGVDLSALDPDGIFAFSSTFADLDGDGWQDLAITVDFRRSRLFWNMEGLAYLDGSGPAGVNRESNGMGSTFGDIDSDGDLDWYVTSIAEADACEDDETPPCWSGTGNRLYSYEGARTYSLITDEAGVRDGAWAWGTIMFDADNDGDQDLALANGWPGRDLHGGLYHADTPTRLWINNGPGWGETFMTEEGELRGVYDRGQGRGIVAFDYDRDGDLDLLVANHAGSPRLFRNDGGNARAWLRVAVEGTTSNHDGRGAKVRVQVEPDGPWQIREVGVASHFLGEGELIQHFGLGHGFELEQDTVHRVEVEWPASGIVQGFDEVGGGQVLVVVEGEP